AYDLELYVTTRDCEGLLAGTYHYNPDSHSLDLVTADTAVRDRLLASAREATGGAGTPVVLISITSRFRRLSWKYRSIGYAVALKNVGALYQTMYLVATAMNLAPCALGSGNSLLVCAAAGLSDFAEVPIGEFILG